MFEALGDIIGTAPAGPRGGAPVRRHSYAKGREGLFWQRTDRKTVQRIVMAAKRYELHTRQPGSQNGALGFVALEVLDYLANLVDFRSGRLEPALTRLMEKLKRSKDSIVRALKCLRAHGFLDWLRRYVPTGNDRGPKVQQTSNAYRLYLPPRAVRLLPKMAPEPDDFAAARDRRAAGLDAYRANLTQSERIVEDIEDPKLRAALLSFASGFECESGNRSESLSKFLSYKD